MCLDDQMLSSYLDGELEEPWKSQVEAHLELCNPCKVRLTELKKIQDKIRDASLSQSEIEARKDRVLCLLNNSVLNKSKHTWWGKIKDFVRNHMFIPIGATAAATFCICLILFTPGVKGETIPYIEGHPVKLDNIIPIRAYDNYATSKTLENYSLEEIIQHLDSIGYNVQLEFKSIVPVLNTQEDSK